MTATSRRTGRRPGSEGHTRAAILGAARGLFAERGLAGTTIRAVATAAGVDPKLVHHYFGTKQELFLAAAEFPVDPEVVRGRIRGVPYAELGHTLALAVLSLWDSGDGTAMLARLRTSVGDDRGSEFGDLLLSAAMPLLTERVRDRLGVDTATADRQVTLAVSQLIGVVVARHVLRFPAAIALSVGELAAETGPVIQGFLDGAGSASD